MIYTYYCSDCGEQFKSFTEGRSVCYRCKPPISEGCKNCSKQQYEHTAIRVGSPSSVVLFCNSIFGSTFEGSGMFYILNPKHIYVGREIGAI